MGCLCYDSDGEEYHFFLREKYWPLFSMNSIIAMNFHLNISRLIRDLLRLPMAGDNTNTPLQLAGAGTDLLPSHGDTIRYQDQAVHSVT